MARKARNLVLSDLHFGSGDDLLGSDLALERLEPELKWAHTVILNGDVWDFAVASIEHAVAASTRFFSLLDQLVERVIFIPGNHDYHFVAQASDNMRWSSLLAEPSPPAFRLAEAEALISRLSPSVEIITGYPLIEIDGVTYTHGHYVTPHLRGFGWQLMGQVGVRLAGMSPKDRKGTLGVTEYEALLAPIQELLYETGQLPEGRRSRDQNERLLTIAANVIRAPGRLGRRVAKVASREPGPEPSKALFPLILPAEATRAMEIVCRNLGVGVGPVCFGHTHSPFAAEAAGWSFHNSGSWMLNSRERDRAHHEQLRHLHWPGTALRHVTGERVEMRRLLDDLSVDQLAEMLPDAESAEPDWPDSALLSSPLPAETL